MKKEYMKKYVIKYCKSHSLHLFRYDTGVYCITDGKALFYLPSLTKLFYLVQMDDVFKYLYAGDVERLC